MARLEGWSFARLLEAQAARQELARKIKTRRCKSQFTADYDPQYHHPPFPLFVRCILLTVC